MTNNENACSRRIQGLHGLILGAICGMLIINNISSCADRDRHVRHEEWVTKRLESMQSKLDALGSQQCEMPSTPEAVPTTPNK